MINKQPEEMKIFHLEVLVMPQGEIICNGKTIGWFKNLSEFLFEVPSGGEVKPELKKGG